MLAVLVNHTKSLFLTPPSHKMITKSTVLVTTVPYVIELLFLLSLYVHVAGWMWNVGCGTCAETAAFHVAPAMQQPQSATSTPLPWILIIRAIKGCSHSFRITHSSGAV